MNDRARAYKGTLDLTKMNPPSELSDCVLGIHSISSRDVLPFGGIETWAVGVSSAPPMRLPSGAIAKRSTTAVVMPGLTKVNPVHHGGKETI